MATCFGLVLKNRAQQNPELPCAGKSHIAMSALDQQSSNIKILQRTEFGRKKKKKKSFQRWQNTDQKRALRGSNTTCSTVLLCSCEEQCLLLLLVQSPRLFISDNFNFGSPEELELFEINLVALLGCL